MSDFDSLREDFAAAFQAIEHSGETTTRAIASIFEEQRKLWADNAALRDDLHALANRVETLTRAHLTEPAETAARMVDGRQS
jgi:hypothetical protein